MRKVAGGVVLLAGGLLAGDVFVKSEDLEDWARVFLVAITALCAIYWLWTTKFLAPRLPSLAFESAGPGFALRFLPPERAGRRRLKRETLDLVKEMHEHMKGKLPIYESVQMTHESWAEMDKTTSEDEKREIWRRQTERLIAHSEGERRENNEKFGGRVEHLLEEYVRRGRLSEDEKMDLLWELGSSHWMSDLARRLETLARGL